jgi:hypothetical protein
LFGEEDTRTGRKMKKIKSLPEPNDVLYRIKRGLSGYVSYLAACEMNESFSEYVLYEPILRVLTARGYDVECEVACPGIKQPKKGDKKKLDFVARKKDLKLTVAIEVKWAKTARPGIDNDLEKLNACRKSKRTWRAFLCVFGTKSCIYNIELPTGVLKERGKLVIADFGKTKFGCRVYELAEQAANVRRASSRTLAATL